MGTAVRGITDPAALPLATKVGALKDRTLYPEHTTKVELVETHMSCVFLTDSFAYKLKKPVRYEFLDFSTIEQRRRNCEEEVRLNRRLAPDTYLSVVPLIVSADGGIVLEGTGATADWLVRMRRLPRDQMLDVAIKQKTLIGPDIERVATLLAGFYTTAQTAGISPSQYCSRFEHDIDINRRELISYGLSHAEVDPSTTSQVRFLREARDLLKRRASDRHIVEGHGDLRPEHIHLGPPPQVIDCLEFNRELRLVDPVDEICFLAVECELLGTAAVGDRVLAAYMAASGDAPPACLPLFYKSFRAFLRARLSIWHLRDAIVDDPKKWVMRAREYVRFGSRYAAALDAFDATGR